MFHLRKVYDVEKLKNPLQIVNCILFLQANVEFVCRMPWKIVFGVAVFREVNLFVQEMIGFEIILVAALEVPMFLVSATIFSRKLQK